MVGALPVYATHSFITRPTTIASQELTTDADTWAVLSWGASTGAVSYTVRWAEDDYPSDNTSGTLGYSGALTTANVTGLTPSTTTYFSVFAIASSGGLSSCSLPAYVFRNYGEEGWLGTWQNRIKLTIPTSSIDADLTDFPVLVHISADSGNNSADLSVIFDELTADAN